MKKYHEISLVEIELVQKNSKKSRQIWNGWQRLHSVKLVPKIISVCWKIFDPKKTVVFTRLNHSIWLKIIPLHFITEATNMSTVKFSQRFRFQFIDFLFIIQKFHKFTYINVFRGTNISESIVWKPSACNFFISPGVMPFTYFIAKNKINCTKLCWLKCVDAHVASTTREKKKNSIQTWSFVINCGPNSSSSSLFVTVRTADFPASLCAIIF